MGSVAVACRLSGPTRDGSLIPCIGGQILKGWTTKEIPLLSSYKPPSYTSQISHLVDKQTLSEGKHETIESCDMKE